jgi:hypothetical protein
MGKPFIVTLEFVHRKMMNSRHMLDSFSYQGDRAGLDLDCLHLAAVWLNVYSQQVRYFLSELLLPSHNFVGISLNQFC